jgi:hypothetical protein
VTRVGAYFDAFGGNLPFKGGRLISTEYGARYAAWLTRAYSAGADADYFALFFNRTASLLGEHGTMGFIAKHTIAVGDTRRAALEPLLATGMVIYDAVTELPWEGASVLVSIVHLAAGRLRTVGTPRRLNGIIVPEISSHLRVSKELGDPKKLHSNAGRAFVGCFLRGEGFVLSRDEAADHLRRFPEEREIVKEYMIGDDLNSSASQQPSRWVISFADAELEEAQHYPGAFAILDERVRPVREKLKSKGADAPHRKYWWRFANTRRELRGACSARTHCLVTARNSMHVVISRVPSRYVFSEQVVVFGSDSFAWLAVLQSRLHEVWVQRFGTRLGEGLRYSATKCLETFPFPADEALVPGSPLEDAGRRLYEARAKYMVDEDVGPTTTYNRLKDPENAEPSIVALRALHAEIDGLVLGAYGWSDLEAPPYVGGDEVEAFQEKTLERLFALNERRSAAEAAPVGPSLARAKVRMSAKRASRSAR